jgi:hypothetical protein
MNLTEITKTIKHESVIDTPRTSLNQHIFADTTIRPRIRKILLHLINELTTEFPFDTTTRYIEEKNMVGSMAGYQWSEQSDIDIHIVIDDETMALRHDIDSAELLQILRDSAKKMNKRFYISGYPVEFYVQAKNEPFYSNGIFDLEANGWTRFPSEVRQSKENIKIAKELARQYKVYILNKIKEIKNGIKKHTKKQGNYKFVKRATEFLDTELQNIKKKRNKAIHTEGDLGFDNLYFKFLQKMKVLEKIKKIKELLNSMQIHYTEEQT